MPQKHIPIEIYGEKVDTKVMVDIRNRLANLDLNFDTAIQEAEVLLNGVVLENEICRKMMQLYEQRRTY